MLTPLFEHETMEEVMMKKIMVTAYGPVDNLHEVTAPVPTPTATQIVIKLAAVGVNDPDVVMRRNGPFPTMPQEMRPTLPHMLGQSFSGVVTQVGAQVTRFHPGDHVLGLAPDGAYAEYIALDQTSVLAIVPAALDLIPLGAFYVEAITAWSALMTNGQLQAGQTVLIHGGAGGVGSLAIQLAKAQGARVITTASARHQAYLKHLGADEMIDYQTQDFTQLVHDVDVVVNMTGMETLNRSYQVLKRGGRLVSINGVPDQNLAAKYGVQASYAIGDLSQAALDQLVALCVAGKMHVTVKQTYPFTLAAVRQAHLDFEQGHNQGKRVIVFGA